MGREIAGPEIAGREINRPAPTRAATIAADVTAVRGAFHHGGHGSWGSRCTKAGGGAVISDRLCLVTAAPGLSPRPSRIARAAPSRSRDVGSIGEAEGPRAELVQGHRLGGAVAQLPGRKEHGRRDVAPRVPPPAHRVRGIKHRAQGQHHAPFAMPVGVGVQQPQRLYVDTGPEDGPTSLPRPGAEVGTKGGTAPVDRPTGHTRGAPAQPVGDGVAGNLHHHPARHPSGQPLRDVRQTAERDEVTLGERQAGHGSEEAEELEVGVGRHRRRGPLGPAGPSSELGQRHRRFPRSHRSAEDARRFVASHRAQRVHVAALVGLQCPAQPVCEQPPRVVGRQPGETHGPDIRARLHVGADHEPARRGHVDQLPELSTGQPHVVEDDRRPGVLEEVPQPRR